MSFIEDSRKELKRVDHQIFVSLKYTRTADVLRNIVERFISCYDLLIEGFLVKKKMDGEIEDIPASPVIRVKEVKRLYKDKIIDAALDKYLIFRKIMNSGYKAINEYRRHVAMIADIDGLEINIDNISEYYAGIKEFLLYVEETYDLDFDDE